MKAFLNNKKNTIEHHSRTQSKRISLIIAVALAALVLSVPALHTFAATTVKQHQTTPQKKIGTSLSFGATGIVSALYAYPGEKVSQGEILAALDTSQLTNQLDEAQAAADFQQVRLTQLQQSAAATSSDSIRLQSYQDALSNAKQNLISTLQDGYVKAEDAVRNRAAQIFVNPLSGNAQTLFNSINQNFSNQLPSQYGNADAVLTAWKSALDTIDTTTDLNAFADLENKNLTQIKGFLDNVAQYINSAQAADTSSLTALRNARSDVYIGRANVFLALAAVGSTKSKIHDAQANIDLQQALMASNIQFGVPLQQDVVRQAQGKVNEIQTQINNMLIRAPGDGVVTKVTIALGSHVNAHVPIIYIKIAPPKIQKSTAFLGDFRNQLGTIWEAFISLWK